MIDQPPPAPPPQRSAEPFPPPPSPAASVPPGVVGPPIPAKKRFSLGTPVIIVLALVVAAGAYFAVMNVTDTPPPTEAEVTAAFVPLPGFEYAEMSPETLAPLESAFASQPGASEAIAHFDARQVSKDGAAVAVVFILSVDPDDMKGAFEDDYITGFTATSQATVSDLEVGDTIGHIAQTPFGTVAFFFDEDGLVFNVVGRDGPTVEEIVGPLESGNS